MVRITYLSEEAISPAEMKAGIRRSVLKAKFLPVMAGTALRNRGVQLVLDAVLDFLPSPLEVAPAKGKHPYRDEEIICK